MTGFQTQLLHYFSKSDNKSNHHHLGTFVRFHLYIYDNRRPFATTSPNKGKPHGELGGIKLMHPGVLANATIYHSTVLECPEVCVHGSTRLGIPRDLRTTRVDSRRGQTTRKNTTALRGCLYDRYDWHTVWIELTCTSASSHWAMVIPISNILDIGYWNHRTLSSRYSSLNHRGLMAEGWSARHFESGRVPVLSVKTLRKVCVINFWLWTRRRNFWPPPAFFLTEPLVNLQQARDEIFSSSTHTHTHKQTNKLRVANTRRDTTAQRCANALRNGTGRGDGNIRRDCWIKIEFREALTVKHPKTLPLVPWFLRVFQTLCWFSISRLLHSLALSEKVGRFPLSSHHTAHPFCGRWIYST